MVVGVNPFENVVEAEQCDLVFPPRPQLSPVDNIYYLQYLQHATIPALGRVAGVWPDHCCYSGQGCGGKMHAGGYSKPSVVKVPIIEME